MPTLRVLIRNRHLQIGAGLLGAGVLAAFGLSLSSPAAVSLASITIRSGHQLGSLDTPTVQVVSAADTDITSDSTAAATVESSSSDGTHSVSVSVSVDTGPSDHASPTAAAQTADIQNTVSVLSTTSGTGTHETSVKINGEDVPTSADSSMIDNGNVHVDLQNTGTLDGSRNESAADIDQTVKTKQSTDADTDNDLDQDVKTGDNDVSGNKDVGSVSNGSTSINLHFSN